jgi:hypothetical protein
MTHQNERKLPPLQKDYMCSTEKCQMFILKKFLANKLKLVCLWICVCLCWLCVPVLAVWCLSWLCRAPFPLLCLCVRMSEVDLIELREALVEHRDREARVEHREMVLRG